MLLGEKRSEIKQIAVTTRNQKFNRLLSRILVNWRYRTVDDLSAAMIVFAERGLALPPCDGQVIWLTPMPLSEGSFLAVPISLTDLYHLLEVNFYPVPRRHIRVTMDEAVDLKTENGWLEGRLVNLSDRGGRIACAQEMPRGTLLQIEVTLAGEALRIPSKVLYCVPGRDFSGRTQPQIGVLFNLPSDVEHDMLRRFIEKTCVVSACASEDIQLKDPCVSWLDVPGDPWKV
jgi:hypothetical protein